MEGLPLVHLHPVMSIMALGLDAVTTCELILHPPKSICLIDFTKIKLFIDTCLFISEQVTARKHIHLGISDNDLLANTYSILQLRHDSRVRVEEER